MIPSGAEYLLSLRSRGMTLSNIIIRLDAPWGLYIPQWWASRGYSAGDWWLYWPEIFVKSCDVISRLDLRSTAGMVVTAVQHGTDAVRFDQLCQRLFACGVTKVIAVFNGDVKALSKGTRCAA